jgi:hypothetical protein
VKSVLIVDTGDVPPAVYDWLEREGWILAQVPDIASALAMLHQVRPAIVLVGSTDGRRDAQALSTLGQDPFMAGVPLVALGSAPEAVLDSGEIGRLAQRLDALVATSR